MELKRWRKLNEISLSTLSDMTGGELSRTSLCNYELGKRFPHPRFIELIQKATDNNVTASDLQATWSAKNKNRKQKSAKKKKPTIKALVSTVVKAIDILPINTREKAILAVINVLSKSMQ